MTDYAEVDVTKYSSSDGESKEKPPEIGRCEHCGQEIDLLLAFGCADDPRLYCSEDCMCKPGESGDWSFVPPSESA